MTEQAIVEATSFTAKQLELFGAFSLVIVILSLVIWWLVKLNVSEKEERREWQGRYIEEGKETQERLFQAVQSLDKVAQILEGRR